MPTTAAARRAIDDREAYAALVPAEGRLIVSQAAGFATHALISTTIPAAAAEAGQTLSVETVHPLPEDDPRGAVMSFYVLALVVGGYIGATVLTALAGAAPASLRNGWRRVVALALYAIVAGSLTTIVTGVGLGHFAGHRLELTGLAIFVVFSVAAFIAALQIAIGILGSLVAMVVLVWLGSQGSSGVVSWELLPVRHPHHGALSPGRRGGRYGSRRSCTSTAPRSRATSWCSRGTPSSARSSCCSPAAGGAEHSTPRLRRPQRR